MLSIYVSERMFITTNKCLLWAMNHSKCFTNLHSNPMELVLLLTDFADRETRIRSEQRRVMFSLKELMMELEN